MSSCYLYLLALNLCMHKCMEELAHSCKMEAIFLVVMDFFSTVISPVLADAPVTHCGISYSVVSDYSPF